MKRFAAVVISLIIIVLFTVTASSAASADFTMSSAQVKPNHIVTLDMVCPNSDLAAAVFEFDYDSGALEFKDVEKDKGVKTKYNITDGKLKVVFYNYNEVSISDNIIFSLKFKALKIGEYKVSFRVSDCVDFVPNDIYAGKCESAVVTVSDNALDSAGSDSESSGSSNQKDKNSDNSKDNSDSKTSDSKEYSGDDDDSEPEYLGTVNDIEEKTSNIYILIYILVAIALAVFIVTGIKIGMYISSRRNKNTEKTDESNNSG